MKNTFMSLVLLIFVLTATNAQGQSGNIPQAQAKKLSYSSVIMRILKMIIHYHIGSLIIMRATDKGKICCLS
jgi:hypothetical protein